MTSIAQQIEFTNNLKDQVKALKRQLDAANQRIAELESAWRDSDAEARAYVFHYKEEKDRAEEAERKLATAKREAICAVVEYVKDQCRDLQDRSRDLARQQRFELAQDRERLADFLWKKIQYAERKALAQIEQPQDAPTESSTDYREIGREMAENRYANLVHAANRGVRCRETLESLISLCKERGLTVGYGEHGQVTLSEDPKQQRPGEDTNEICQCPACVTIRAKVRSKP